MNGAGGGSVGQQKAQKGWLSRWTRKQWSRHWFVLKSGSLTYYRGPAAELCSFLDGVLDLSLIKQIEVQQGSGGEQSAPNSNQQSGCQSSHSHYATSLAGGHQSHPSAAANQHQQQFTFSLKMWNGECHLLGAATSAERSLWLEAIQAASSLGSDSQSCSIVGDDEISNTDSSSTSSSSESSPTSNLSAKSTDICFGNSSYQQQQQLASLDHQLALSLKSAISRRREQEKQLLELALSNSLSTTTTITTTTTTTTAAAAASRPRADVGNLERQQMRPLGAIRHLSAKPEIVRCELGRKKQQQQELRKLSASKTLIDTRSVKIATATPSQQSNEKKPQERSSQERNKENENDNNKDDRQDGDDDDDDDRDDDDDGVDNDEDVDDRDEDDYDDDDAEDEEEEEKEEEEEEDGDEDVSEQEGKVDKDSSTTTIGCSKELTNSQAFKRRLMCTTNTITSGDVFSASEQTIGPSELKLIGRRQQADLYQKRAIVLSAGASGKERPLLCHSLSRSAGSSEVSSESDDDDMDKEEKKEGEDDKENGGRGEEKGQELGQLTGRLRREEADEKVATSEAKLTVGAKFNDVNDMTLTKVQKKPFERPNLGDNGAVVAQQQQQQKKRVTFDLSLSSQRQLSSGSSCSSSEGSDSESSLSTSVSSSNSDQEEEAEEEQVGDGVDNEEDVGGELEEERGAGGVSAILSLGNIDGKTSTRAMEAAEAPQGGAQGQCEDEQPMDAICSGEQEAVDSGAATHRQYQELAPAVGRLMGAGSGRANEPNGGHKNDDGDADSDADADKDEAEDRKWADGGDTGELKRRLEVAQASVGLLEQRLSGSLASYQQLEFAYKRLQSDFGASEQLHRTELARMRARQDELSRELAASQARLAEARAKLLKFEANHQLPSKALASWLRSAAQSQTASIQQQLHQNLNLNQHQAMQQVQQQQPLLLTMHHVKQQGGFGALVANQQQTTISLKLLNQSKQIQRKLNELEIKVDKIQSSGCAGAKAANQQPLVN